MQRGDADEAGAQCAVDRPLRPARVEDASEVDKGARHPGGHDPVDDGEVVGRERPPPVHEPGRAPVAACAGRRDLWRPAAWKTGEAEQRSRGPVGGRGVRAGGQAEGGHPLFPGLGSAPEAVQAIAHALPPPGPELCLGRVHAGEYHGGVVGGDAVSRVSTFDDVLVHAARVPAR